MSMSIDSPELGQIEDAYQKGYNDGFAEGYDKRVEEEHAEGVKRGKKRWEGKSIEERKRQSELMIAGKKKGIDNTKKEEYNGSKGMKKASV